LTTGRFFFSTPVLYPYQLSCRHHAVRAVEYVLDNFKGQLLNALENLGDELGQIRRRKERLEREVVNLADVVARGEFSPALRAALVGREREIVEITAKLLESQPDSLRAKLPNIHSFVTTNMRQIREIVNADRVN
jgi:hypothetical protein